MQRLQDAHRLLRALLGTYFSEKRRKGEQHRSMANDNVVSVTDVKTTRRRCRRVPFPARNCCLHGQMMLLALSVRNSWFNTSRQRIPAGRVQHPRAGDERGSSQRGACHIWCRAGTTSSRRRSSGFRCCCILPPPPPFAQSSPPISRAAGFATSVATPAWCLTSRGARYLDEGVLQCVSHCTQSLPTRRRGNICSAAKTPARPHRCPPATGAGRPALTSSESLRSKLGGLGTRGACFLVLQLADVRGWGRPRLPVRYGDYATVRV